MAEQDIRMIAEVKSSRDFTGKVVLITGSSSGIGKCTAKLFAGLGAQVVVNGRNAEKVSTAAKEVNQLSPKKLKALEVVVDFYDLKQVTKLLDDTVKHFGRLDVLVNNVGLFQFDSINSDSFLTDLDKPLNLDLKAALHITRLSIPHLSRTKGNIINISWTFLSIPVQGVLGFQIAKAGIEMSTKVLAQDLGPKGIRVNCVRPGIHDSHGKNFEAVDPVTPKRTPLGRYGTSSDISKVIAFLASTDAEFMTGAIVDVDGGLAFATGGGTMLESPVATQPEYWTAQDK